MATMYENLWGNSVGRIELTFPLTVHSRPILKIVKSMCIGIKKSNSRLRNVTQMSTLPHPHSCHMNFRT
jgi:hypothetical protein